MCALSDMGRGRKLLAVSRKLSPCSFSIVSTSSTTLSFLSARRSMRRRPQSAASASSTSSVRNNSPSFDLTDATSWTRRLRFVGSSSRRPL